MAATARGGQAGPFVRAGPGGSAGLARILARNTAFSLCAQAGVKLVSAAFGVYVVRHLGDWAYGRYSTALALVGLISMLAELGVTQYGIREIAKDRSRTESLLSAMTFARLGLSTLGIGVCVAAALLLRYDLELVRAVLLASAVYIVFAVQGPLDVLLRAYERLDLASALLAGSQLLFVAIGAPLLLVGGGYFGLLWASLGATAVATVLTWHVVGRWVVRPCFVVNPRDWASIVRGSVPFALSGIGILVSDRIGTVMLSAWRPVQEVGWYAVAVNLTSSLLLLWSSFAGAMVPSLSRESVADRTVVGHVFERAALAIVALYLPVAVGTTVVAESVVTLLYTDGFLPTVGALQILIWVLPVRTLAFFCGGIAWVIGEERAMARVYLLSALLEAGLNAALIPRLGMYGTALAAVVAAVVALAQFLFLLRRAVPIPPGPAALAGVVLASSGMGAVALALTWACHLNLFVVVSASAACYGGLLFTLGVVTVADVRRTALLALASVRRFEDPSTA